MKRTIKNFFIILAMIFAITACNGGGASTTPSAPISPGKIVVYSLALSPNPASISYNQESMVLTLSAESFVNNDNIEVTLYNSDNRTILLNTTTCILSKNNPSCFISVKNGFNPSGGSSIITASAASYKPATIEVMVNDVPTIATWIAGESAVNQQPQYGTKGIANASNTPGARYSYTSWTDANGNFWLFGGYVNNLRMNDLWKYNIVTNQWTWVSGENLPNQFGKYGIKGVSSPNNEPGSRQVSMGWTDASGNLWLFGGNGVSSIDGGMLNDLWKYNPISNEWTWVSGESVANQKSIYGIQNVPSINNIPGARASSSIWSDGKGNLWLYGGAGPGSTFLGDLWKYNIVSNEWTWVNGESKIDAPSIYGTRGVSSPANTPGGRYGTTEWSDGSGNLWFLGGADSSFAYNNDVWEYNPFSNEWTWVSGSNKENQAGVYGIQNVSSPSNIVGARVNSIIWHEKNTDNLWFLGGAGYDENGSYGDLNDLWKYNPSLNQWTWVDGSSIINQIGVYGVQGIPSPNNIPGARSNAGGWSDNQGNFWLFGGRSEFSKGYSDLWKITPSSF